MAYLNQILDITSDLPDRVYSHCIKRKSLSEFTKFYNDKIKQLDTCNNCSKKRIKKSSNFVDINEDNSDASKIPNQFDYQDENSDLENNEDDCVLYELTE